MKIKILILALALSMMVAGLALANNGVELPRWVLGGGASDSGADNVSLRATLGQPVAGVVSSEEVTLGQGFWHGVTPGYSIYLPLVVTNHQP
jgi:hypothetical protein